VVARDKLSVSLPSSPFHDTTLGCLGLLRTGFPSARMNAEESEENP
jgi:hypothetical protein